MERVATEYWWRPYPHLVCIVQRLPHIMDVRGGSFNNEMVYIYGGLVFQLLPDSFPLSLAKEPPRDEGTKEGAGFFWAVLG